MPRPTVWSVLRNSPGLILLWLVAITAGGLAYLMWDRPSAYSAERAAEHRLCDQAIDALVHSKDPVELQRAGVIVPALDCSIGRWLATDK